MMARIQAHYKRAFTLIELLVGIGLLLLLGLMLVILLQQTLHNWHYTESQAMMHADSRKVFAYLRDDLENVMVSSDVGSEISLLAEHGKSGGLGLRLVRRLPQECLRPVLRQAGVHPISAGALEYYQEPPVNPDKLRATGGLAEVMYVMLPTKDGMELWRGVRAPIGGSGSLFQDNNLDSPNKVYAAGHRIASELLHLQLQWSGDISSQPSEIWDSSLVRNPKFVLYQSKTVTPPVWPMKVQINLILRGAHTASAILAKEITMDETTFSLRESRAVADKPLEKYVLMIESECIAYGEYSGGRLTAVQRGLYGTMPQSHPAGTKVYGGRCFTVTVSLPSHQSDWWPVGK